VKVPKKALLIIDMLNDFVQEGGALYTGEAGHRVIPVISKVLKRARIAINSQGPILGKKPNMALPPPQFLCL
jgi:hypothetical protein